MKRLIKPTLILLVLCFICAYTGCGEQKDAQKFFIEYMNAIPIEIDGYSIEEIANYNSQKIESTEGAFIIQDEIIEIVLENDTYYYIKYNGHKLRLDYDFMRERSKTYQKIHDLWYVYRNNPQEERNYNYAFNKIEAVMVFDEKIFICTQGIRERLLKTVENKFPYTIYVYDLKNDKIYYADYYNRLDFVKPTLFIEKQIEDG